MLDHKLWLLLLLFPACKEAGNKKSIEKFEVYKFYRVARLPNQLEIIDKPLAITEKIALDSVLIKRDATYFKDNKGNFYLLYDKVQDDILLQFWTLSDDIDGILKNNDSLR